jgi:hypothetical protein
LLLDQYLEGWAETNLNKIFSATTPEYRFDDAHVGRFSRWSLATYFEHLKRRFERAGGCTTRDLAFYVQGPTDGPLRCGRLIFFREAPLLGLKHDAVPQLHQSIGPNFVTTLVVPEIGNRMRENHC